MATLYCTRTLLILVIAACLLQQVSCGDKDKEKKKKQKGNPCNDLWTEVLKNQWTDDGKIKAVQKALDGGCVTVTGPVKTSDNKYKYTVQYKGSHVQPTYKTLSKEHSFNMSG